jgi:hypothetical protein
MNKPSVELIEKLLSEILSRRTGQTVKVTLTVK